MHTVDSNPLRRAVDHAAHLLPTQGPIGVFIHHNTLHAFQHERFEGAVVKAAGVFLAEPYLTEAAYRRDFARKRIQQADIDWVLAREPNAEVIPGRLDRQTLRRAMIDPRMVAVDALSVSYLLEEAGHFTGTPESLDLWVACQRGADQPAANRRTASRPREGVLWSGGPDLDAVIHPLLIRLCAVYTDQGTSYWPMPGREKGFYGSVRDLLAQPGVLHLSELRGVDDEFRKQRSSGLTSEDVVRQMSLRLGVPETDWQSFLEAELLALPGWPGLMLLLERDPGLAPHIQLPCSLMDFIAVRLTFTAVALTNTADNTAAWRIVNAETASAAALRRLEAAQMFEAAKAAGVMASELNRLDEAAFGRWRAEVSDFSEIERRRVWHLAYERRHELLILGPLGHYRQSHPDRKSTRLNSSHQ